MCPKEDFVIFSSYMSILVDGTTIHPGVRLKSRALMILFVSLPHLQSCSDQNLQI